MQAGKQPEVVFANENKRNRSFVFIVCNVTHVQARGG